MKYKAVLWDKDGTLMDSFAQWIMREELLLEKLCAYFQVPEVHTKAVITKGLWNLGIREGRVDSHSPLAFGTERMLVQVLATTLSAYVKIPEFSIFFENVQGLLNQIILQDTSRVPARLGILEVVQFLRDQGVPQGIATSDSRGNTEKELKEAGLWDYFSYFALGDEVPKPKPDPWSLLHFAEALQIHTRSILMIGDSPADEQMAKAAGADFIALLGGTGRAEDFESPLAVLEEVCEIKAYFRTELLKTK